MRMQGEGFTVLPLIIGEYNREIKEGLLSFEEATERAEQLSKKQGIPVGVYIPIARFEPQVPTSTDRSKVPSNLTSTLEDLARNPSVYHVAPESGWATQNAKQTDTRSSNLAGSTRQN